MLKPTLKKQPTRPFNYEYIKGLLFGNDEQGAFFVPAPRIGGDQVLYQDDAGTTPVESDGDPVGLLKDLSGNDNHASQDTSSARPTYRTDGDHLYLEVDGVDDNMDVGLPDGEYEVLQGTMDGVLEYKIEVTNGDGWQLYGNPDHTPNDSITGIVLRDGGVDGARNYVESLGQGTRFSGVTSMKRWFLDRSDVIEIHSGNWDTSNVTDCSDFAYGCNNLTKLDVSNWDTSNVTTFGSFAYECNNLTKLDVSNWDTSNVTKFYRFARGCNSLTELDVSNWDTSNVTDFRYFSRDCPSLENVIVTGGTGNPFADSPCTNYNLSFTNTNLNQQSIDDILVAIESAGTSDGTFGQSGGSAPSSTGEAAIDSLRSRGWTVTVTGGY